MEPAAQEALHFKFKCPKSAACGLLLTQRITIYRGFCQALFLKGIPIWASESPMSTGVFGEYSWQRCDFELDILFISRYYLITYNNRKIRKIDVVIAVLGDIHGNSAALNAILDDIDSFGILTIFHTGDCVCGNSGNREVVETLQEKGILGAKGEWDHRLVRYIRKQKTMAKKLSIDELQMLDEAYNECISSQIEYLNGLPRTLKTTLDGIDIAVCHGTINSHQDTLKADDDDGRYMRQRELMPAQIIVSGRTHQAHSRQIGDTLFVNPGSVGMNDDGLARYAIISTEEQPWSAEFRDIPV
jgi:putative phosphoesterase